MKVSTLLITFAVLSCGAAGPKVSPDKAAKEATYMHAAGDDSGGAAVEAKIATHKIDRPEKIEEARATAENGSSGPFVYDFDLPPDSSRVSELELHELTNVFEAVIDIRRESLPQHLHLTMDPSPPRRELAEHDLKFGLMSPWLMEDNCDGDMNPFENVSGQKSGPHGVGVPDWAFQKLRNSPLTHFAAVTKTLSDHSSRVTPLLIFNQFIGGSLTDEGDDFSTMAACIAHVKEIAVGAHAADAFCIHQTRCTQGPQLYQGRVLHDLTTNDQAATYEIDVPSDTRYFYVDDDMLAHLGSALNADVIATCSFDSRPVLCADAWYSTSIDHLKISLVEKASSPLPKLNVVKMTPWLRGDNCGVPINGVIETADGQTDSDRRNWAEIVAGIFQKLRNPPLMSASVFNAYDSGLETPILIYRDFAGGVLTNEGDYFHTMASCLDHVKAVSASTHSVEGFCLMNTMCSADPKTFQARLLYDAPAL